MYSEQLISYLYKYDLPEKKELKDEVQPDMPVLHVLKGLKALKSTFATVPVKNANE